MLMVFYYLYAYPSGKKIYIQTLRGFFFFFFLNPAPRYTQSTLGIVILLAGVSPEQHTSFHREKKKKKKKEKR